MYIYTHTYTYVYIYIYVNTHRDTWAQRCVACTDTDTHDSVASMATPSIPTNIVQSAPHLRFSKSNHKRALARYAQ